MINNGKRFEQNFKNSVPEDLFLYRLKDGTASWGRNDQVRFQVENICDYILYAIPNLFLFELKSHKGASLPLSCVKEHQYKELLKSSYKGVTAGLIVEFSDKQKVYWLDIRDYDYFVKNNERKSIPIDYFESEGIEIEITKLIKNIRLDIEGLIKNMEG